MMTPASIAKHPLHPMLIVFPIGLWVFSFACDVFYLFLADAPIWYTVSIYAMAGGIIGALIAAVPGLVDYLSLRDRLIKRIATWHMVLNLTLVVLFAINLWLRLSEAPVGSVPFWISAISMALLGISAWLGADLVHVHAIGVETGARSVDEGADPKPSIPVSAPR